MGWDYRQGASRQDIVNDLLKEYYTGDFINVRTLDYSRKGNVLWVVREMATGVRFIDCNLLNEDKRFGWGSKTIDHNSHPYYYNCPVKFLDYLRPSDYTPEGVQWAEKVREVASKRKQKFEVGQEIRLTNGWDVVIASARPLTCTYQGKRYRLPRKLLP